MGKYIQKLNKLAWKLDNKHMHVKEANILKNEKVVVSSKPGLEEEKGGERGLQRKRRWRRRKRKKKTQEKSKNASLNPILQKFTINIRGSKKNGFSPLLWHPASLDI